MHSRSIPFFAIICIIIGENSDKIDDGCIECIEWYRMI